MRKVWIEITELEKSLITDCLENSVDAFFVKEESLVSKIKDDKSYMSNFNRQLVWKIYTGNTL